LIKTKHSHTISGVFVFFLLGVFAVSATLMVLLGAQAYKEGADRGEMHSAERIASSYLRGKLREADSRDMILLEDVDGAESLKIINTEEETVTLLFVRDGMLCEWYTFQNLFDEAELDPDTGAPLPVPFDSEGEEEDGFEEETLRGETVCPLDEMRLSLKGQILTVNLRHGQEWTAVDFALKSAPH